MSIIENHSTRQLVPEGYGDFLKRLKQRIKETQLKAAIAANRELILLYWDIGRQILESQDKEGWGAKIIDRLAADLKHEFPDMKGFSPRNLKYMRTFAKHYPDREFVQAVLAQITWYHNIAIFEKIKESDERKWYIHKTIEHGWSRSVLVHQIESGLYRREGKSLTNFSTTLPKPQSDLAIQTLKDPYVFDFLSMTGKYDELELEKELVKQITHFLLEMGAGFAYIGRQVPLAVGEREFFIDLLFYHTHLHCYVVVELKTGEFEPEHAGQLNFYIKAVDSQYRQDGDQATIGILLCKSKDKLVAEYALSDIHKPIGVSEYQLSRYLPDNLKSSLPSSEELERELAGLGNYEEQGDK
ncbi:MAG: PDDEXK nuclease domain-containing protein [Candidatus Aminicenantes bacterium]|nr:PDDEXK nuclease domain-containing protein [Candidatus Aminicenantes bacterium]